MLELDLHRTRLGAIAISAAAIDDVVGWLLLAVVSALAVANFSPGGFALKLLMLAAYIAVCVLVVRPLLLKLIQRSRVTATSLPLDLMGVLIAAMFFSGMVTYKIGIFAIFGGFMMGVLLHDQL
jgi:Kef-type K+ transport system membrane component KefB